MHLVSLLIGGVSFLKLEANSHPASCLVVAGLQNLAQRVRILQTLLCRLKLLLARAPLSIALASVLQFPPPYRAPHHIFLISLRGLPSRGRGWF